MTRFVPGLLLGLVLGLALAVIPVGLILRERYPNPDGVGAGWAWNDCFEHAPLIGEGHHAFSEWRVPCP